MGRFLNRKPADSERAQDTADYQAQQAKRDHEGNRDDANTGGNWQPADGQYIDRGTRWGGWS